MAFAHLPLTPYKGRDLATGEASSMGLVEALYLLPRAFVVSRATLTAENLALRQQLSVL